MRLALFFGAIFLIAANILLLSNNEDRAEAVSVVTQERTAGMFLNYVEALNKYFISGAIADGDVSTLITLPSWLPRSGDIGLQVIDGVGYVFMPSVPGLLKQVMRETDNSVHFGLSDASGINTPAGILPRPGVIPPGYVVYVR
ncbi:type IV pilus biogenesis protein PilM [Erwinia rhapontici]|uniref:type IV pilus biogenesis protein PilM n=1 Tax=Erwinia rhapontici TaxID=55212 RepID=UPI00133153D1|nr:type IV pilus biogenesis protein PilM [Erwinia rhapontici]MBP2157395.1 hypothetical protein [Erwinia rhapontici]